MASYPVAVGDVLAGKYRVETIIGKGGMGVVVAATHLQLKEQVALKFLLPQAASQSEFAARFEREARLMAKLRSEHAVRVIDVGVLDSGAPYMVMELLDGTDLRDIIREVRQVPLDVALDYFLQACEGVAEAHAQGIIHRDLKPTNIFVTQRRDGSSLVKVLDFGISKFQGEGDEDDQLTGAATILGSPRYMPPEQLRSSRDVDQRADVWALGAILQELLTGQPPFAGANTTATCAAIMSDPPRPLRDLRPDLPVVLEAVVARCFEKDPAARWQSVGEMVGAVYDASGVEDAGYALRVERIERLSAPVSLSSSGGRAAVLARSGAGNALGQTGTNPSLSRTGTTSSRRDATPVSRRSAPTTAPVSGPVAPPDETRPEVAARSSPRGMVLGGLVMSALLIGGVVVWQRSASTDPKGPAASSPPITSTTTVAPPVTAALVPTATTALVASAVVESAPAASATATDSKSTRDGKAERGDRGRPTGRPPSTTPPPTAAPQAAPTKEKPVANPLEDRQ